MWGLDWQLITRSIRHSPNELWNQMWSLEQKVGVLDAIERVASSIENIVITWNDVSFDTDIKGPSFLLIIGVVYLVKSYKMRH